MKFPRDVSGDRLIRALGALGYSVSRQDGSHVRLFHSGPPPHHITVPRHSALKTGTLRGIITEVARARAIPVENLTRLL